MWLNRVKTLQNANIVKIKGQKIVENKAKKLKIFTIANNERVLKTISFRPRERKFPLAP